MFGNELKATSFAARQTLPIALCLISLLLYSHVSAQPPTLIRGTVLDSHTGEPIPIVNVVVMGTPFGAATDSAGYFQIRNLPPDLYVLEFRHVAYRKRIHILPLKESEQVTFAVEMHEEVITLDSVEVVSNPDRARRMHQTYASTVITEVQIAKNGSKKLTEILRTFEPGSGATSLTQRRRMFPTTSWVPYLIYLDGAYVQYIPGALDNIVDVNQIEKIEISRWVGVSPNIGPGTSDRVISITTKKPR
jgi:hypothetical protein